MLADKSVHFPSVCILGREGQAIMLVANYIPLIVADSWVIIHYHCHFMPDVSKISVILIESHFAFEYDPIRTIFKGLQSCDLTIVHRSSFK